MDTKQKNIVNMKKFFIAMVKNILAHLGLKIVKLSPMEKVLFKLQSKGVNLKDLNALEVFGWIGTMHTQDYAKKVNSLDIWEFDPDCEKFLKSNLPMSNVKITDSLNEIKVTDRKYNLIVVDNPSQNYGDNERYTEHFDLFSHIFRIMQDKTILILNVIPKIEEIHKASYPSLFNKKHLERRSLFYSTNTPEKIDIKYMVSIYSKYAKDNGFTVDWSFAQKRSFVYYLVLKLHKTRNSI